MKVINIGDFHKPVLIEETSQKYIMYALICLKFRNKN